MVRLSAVGQIVRRRWRLLAGLATVGALLGSGASLVFSPGYESSSSVLLQGPLEDAELQTEAQIAVSSIVLDRTVAALGWDVSGAELRDSVSAEVADGNVIEIRGSAESPERAQQLTNRVTREYATFSTELVNRAAGASAQALETIQQRVADTNSRIVELQQSAPGTLENAQGRTELEQLRTTMADAITKLEEISGGEQGAGAEAAFGEASIVVLEPATRASGPAEPTLVQFAAGGALLLFLLGVFAPLVAARADRRLRSDSQIAAALGSAVVGSVDVPDVPTAHEPSTGPRGWRARMWRLVRDDRAWDAPQHPMSVDGLNRDVPYRRVLARLRGAPGAGLRLLVLVAHDDLTAHRAVAQLAVAAGLDGSPASIVTDRADVARMLQAAAGNAGMGNVRLTVRPSSDPAPGNHRTVLHVVDVSAARPVVPDGGRVSGALVVITAGTRTAWELVGIGEACADAGHRVVGAFVTNRTRPIDNRPIDNRPIEATRLDPPTISADGKAMAGPS